MRPVKVISRTVLLTIPCTGERKMRFMAELTYGGTVGVSDISASFFCIEPWRFRVPPVQPGMPGMLSSRGTSRCASATAAPSRFWGWLQPFSSLGRFRRRMSFLRSAYCWFSWFSPYRSAAAYYRFWLLEVIDGYLWQLHSFSGIGSFQHTFLAAGSATGCPGMDYKIPKSL